MQSKVRKALVLGAIMAILVLAVLAIFRFDVLNKFRNRAPEYAKEPPILIPSPPPLIPASYFQGGDMRSTPVKRLYDNLAAPEIGVVPGNQLIRFLDASSNSLVELDLQSRNVRSISNSFERKIAMVKWSPSTKKAIIYQRSEAGLPFELSIYNTETHSNTALNREFASLVWKDDDTIWANRYLMPPENTQNTIVEIDANNGTVLRTVFALPQGLQRAVGTFSTDRSIFAFAENTATTPQDIFLYDLTSSITSKLTNGGTNVIPNVSPDGEWIVYYKVDSPKGIVSAELRAMRTDGSDDHSLGIRTAQFVSLFVNSSTILALTSMEIPQDCQRMRSDYRCYAYGDIIALNNIVAANVVRGTDGPLFTETEWGSFGFPRVVAMLPVGSSLIFIDLRSNKLYILNDIL